LKIKIISEFLDKVANLCLWGPYEGNPFLELEYLNSAGTHLLNTEYEQKFRRQ
jgi:hypothetical protein